MSAVYGEKCLSYETQSMEMGIQMWLHQFIALTQEKASHRQPSVVSKVEQLVLEDCLKTDV